MLKSSAYVLQGAKKFRMGIVNYKKKLKLVFLLTWCLFMTAGCSDQPNWSRYTQKPLFQADPTIYSEQGVYYLYGTNEMDTSQGIRIFESKDLVHWKNPFGGSGKLALKKGDSFGNGDFWAPQVFRHKNLYYMAYVADEQISIATSTSPLGPFKQTLLQPFIRNTQYKTIDPYVFFDDDGQIYLYFVEENGGNNINVVKLKDKLSGVEENTQKTCITATEPWENTANATWPVTEGPTVIKKFGTYYLFYSANDFRNDDYAVGYATSSSPMGPWKKHDGPILSKNIVLADGTGHGDIFIGKNNQLYYVFHTHYASDAVSPRKTAIIKLTFTPQKKGPGIFAVDAKSFDYIKQYVKSKN